jgi:hypothetical protein
MLHQEIHPMTTDVITFVCARCDVYDLSENEINVETVFDTVLGEAIQSIRDGEPIDASTYIHLNNAGIDPERLQEVYQ